MTTKQDNKDVQDLDDIINKTENIVQEKTELGEVMTSLNSDVVDSKTKMSEIDMNSRLTGEQISGSLIFDELQRQGLFSQSCAITRQMKRLVISRNGLGRQEKVNIVMGQREHTSKDTLGNRFMSIFKRDE